MMNTKLSLALIPLALALLPALSFGTEPVETTIAGKAPAPSVVVRYDDLDLSTHKGVQSLEARLRDAAFKVCGQMLDRQVSIQRVECQNELVEHAQQQVSGR